MISLAINSISCKLLVVCIILCSIWNINALNTLKFPHKLSVSSKSRESIKAMNMIANRGSDSLKVRVSHICGIGCDCRSGAVTMMQAKSSRNGGSSCTCTFGCSRCRRGMTLCMTALDIKKDVRRSNRVCGVSCGIDCDCRSGLGSIVLTRDINRRQSCGVGCTCINHNVSSMMLFMSAGNS